jgi:hypothetical protein
MRELLAAAMGAAVISGCSPDSDKTNPAVATDEAVAEREAQAPAVGASSFTEGQARDRITGAGYTDVTGLMQAADGTWRGTAMMAGQSASVVVDYQGNVTAAPSDPAVPASPGTPPAPVQPTP